MRAPNDASAPAPPVKPPVKRTPRPSSPGSSGPAQGSIGAFAKEVLRLIKAPATPANIAFITAWANREGGGGSYNPLNSGWNMPGSTPFNDSGVQNYTSLDMAAHATANNLLKQGNGHTYADLVSAFRTGKADVNQTYNGLGSWSGGGYQNLSGVPTSPNVTISTDYSPVPKASKQTVDSNVLAQYGYLAGYLHNPEIGPILRTAADQGWDIYRLQGALSKTKWWQTTGESARKWDELVQTDPATARERIATESADLMAQASKSGLVIDPKRMSQLVMESLRMGWDPQQISNALVSEGKFDPNAPGVKGSVSSLKKIASDYMVPLSDNTLAQWMKNIASGKVNQNDFLAYSQEQAKSMFPSLSNAIDRGVTVEQYAEPYRQMAAQTLEVDPQSIDFMHNPTYSKALFQVDQKTGDRSPMALGDWQEYLRNLPAYGNTKQAMKQADDLAFQLGQSFGKVM